MSAFCLDTYLKTFLNWEQKLQQASPAAFGLERVEALLAVFGYPQNDLRFAHVAGTKGKGSTCAFLASILAASGYRVGLYTSPHLHSLTERIRIVEKDSSSCIAMSEVEDRLRYHYAAIDRLRAGGVEITFYELMTALAVAYFASKKVQIVVLETGLGGRLDATNVLETSVCGLTPVGFDHMNILGDTLGAIAAEKAGIIRFPCQRVVNAAQPPEVRKVIDARCAAFGIVPVVIGEDLPLSVNKVVADGVTFTVEGRRVYRDLFSPLTGAHQAGNAALAIGMAEELETFGYLLTEESVRQGIASVNWPARFERVSEDPVVILDCAHTPESAAALAATFEAAYPGSKAVVVLGMSADKDPVAFIRALCGVMQHLVLTKADNPRARDLAEVVSNEIFSGLKVVLVPNVKNALGEARRLAGQNGLVLVTGSVFVCAEVRPFGNFAGNTYEVPKGGVPEKR